MSNITNMNDRELMEAIYKSLNEIKSDINLVNSKYEQLSIELNTKVDILCNFKPAAQKSDTDGNGKKKIPTRLNYIKDKIKENKDEFLDDLYSQEEYDECAKTVEDKKTNSKKTEEEKFKQVIELLYKNIINIKYKEKATEIYNKFKKEFKDAVPVTTIPCNDLDDA